MTKVRVDADALEALDDQGLDRAGDQPADQQDDEEADESWQECHELVQALLDPRIHFS